MPLPLIALILAAAAAVTVVVLVMLNWSEIVDWFRSRSDLKEQDKQNIAFTLQEKMTKGEYVTIQGIFNKKTNKIVDGRKIRSENIDEEVRAAHKEQLAIYN